MHDEFSKTVQLVEQAIVRAQQTPPAYATARTLEKAIARTAEHIVHAQRTRASSPGRGGGGSPLSGMFNNIGTFGNEEGVTERQSYIQRERNILKKLVALKESNKCRS